VTACCWRCRSDFCGGQQQRRRDKNTASCLVLLGIGGVNACICEQCLARCSALRCLGDIALAWRHSALSCRAAPARGPIACPLLYARAKHGSISLFDDISCFPERLDYSTPPYLGLSARERRWAVFYIFSLHTFYICSSYTVFGLAVYCAAFPGEGGKACLSSAYLVF